MTTFVRQNQDFKEYLIKDYDKDEEWVIPKNYRHYDSSQNISYRLEFETIPESFSITKETSKEGYQVIEELIRKNNQEVPWEFYIKWHWENQEIKDKENQELIKNFVDNGKRQLKSGEWYHY